MPLPLLSARRARLDPRLDPSILDPPTLPTLPSGGTKPGPTPSLPSPRPSLLPSGLPRPSFGPGSSSNSSSPGDPDSSSPSSGSGSGSSSGSGTTVIPGSTANPPSSSSTTTTTTSSGTKSPSSPLIFVNGAPVPLLAIVLPVIFAVLALFLGSLFFLYRKARKSPTPVSHRQIILRSLLIASFLWIPLLLSKHALRGLQALGQKLQNRQRRGTLIIAGDVNAAYSKLDDHGGGGGGTGAPPMTVTRTSSPDAEFLGLYGRYAPQPQPPVGVVVLRPAAAGYGAFVAPPPYEAPRGRTSGGAAAAGGGEDLITPVDRPVTAPGRVR